MFCGLVYTCVLSAQSGTTTFADGNQYCSRTTLLLTLTMSSSPFRSASNPSLTLQDLPFRPTPESIPPHNVSYMQKPLHSAPVNYHPLVGRLTLYIQTTTRLTLVCRTQLAFCCMPLSYTRTSLPLSIPMLTSRLSTRIVYGDSVIHTLLSLV